MLSMNGIMRMCVVGYTDGWMIGFGMGSNMTEHDRSAEGTNATEKEVGEARFRASRQTAAQGFKMTAGRS
jgi:hypothetical protein